MRFSLDGMSEKQQRQILEDRFAPGTLLKVTASFLADGDVWCEVGTVLFVISLNVVTDNVWDESHIKFVAIASSARYGVISDTFNARILGCYFETVER